MQNRYEIGDTLFWQLKKWSRQAWVQKWNFGFLRCGIKIKEIREVCGSILKMETCKKEVCKRSDFGQNGNKIWVRSSEVSIYEGLSGVLDVKK